MSRRWGIKGVGDVRKLALPAITAARAVSFMLLVVSVKISSDVVGRTFGCCGESQVGRECRWVR